MDESTQKQWQELSEEILSGIKEWREAHPQATFAEIEVAIHERVSRLEARLQQDVALSSPLTDWRQAPPQERPACPTCGTPLQARGKQKRCLQSRGGKPVELTRSYGSCPVCGTGFFPPR